MYEGTTTERCPIFCIDTKAQGISSTLYAWMAIIVNC